MRVTTQTARRADASAPRIKAYLVIVVVKEAGLVAVEGAELREVELRASEMRRRCGSTVGEDAWAYFGAHQCMHKCVARSKKTA